MNKVAIVTDSAASIPEELIHEYGIQVVPLQLILDDKTYLDRIDIRTADELFQLVKKSSKFPTTSAPPPTNYLEAYRQLNQETDSILCITISSDLSMCFNSATIAKEMAQSELPDANVEIFDSKTTVGAMGFIALAAARAAASGQDMTAVVNTAKDVKSKVNMVYVMDTLSYLARSGRIGKAKALLGNMLNMKPIVEITTSLGIPSPVTRARTKEKAIQRLLEIMEQRVGTSDPVHIMVEHTCSPYEAKRLKEIVLDQFSCAEILLCEFNPVASLIVGPGLIGLDFYKDSP